MNTYRVTEQEFLEEIYDMLDCYVRNGDKDLLNKAVCRVEEQLNAIKCQPRDIKVEGCVNIDGFTPVTARFIGNH